jgi:hypothetical protein
MDAAFLIHLALGPGLLVTVYAVILTRKLSEMGVAVEGQVLVPIQFENIFKHDFKRMVNGLEDR